MHSKINLNIFIFSGRRARVIGGFEEEEATNFIDTGNYDQFLKVFEEVNKVVAKQTRDKLSVADEGFITAEALVSASLVTTSSPALLLIAIFMKMWF